MVKIAAVKERACSGEKGFFGQIGVKIHPIHRLCTTSLLEKNLKPLVSPLRTIV